MLQGFFWEGTIDENFVGHICAEVWKDRVYAPYIEGKKDLVTVDIGANIGLVSFYFSKYSKIVYAIEPATEHYDCLTRMIAFNKVKNIKPFKLAIHIDNLKLPLYRNKNKTMYSLHQSVRDPNLKPEMVDCVTLDKFFNDNNIDQVDVMKLDIEGSEVEVISSRGFRKVAPRIKTIILERHKWSGRHPNQIIDALKSNGFSVQNIPNQADLLVGQR